MAEYSYDPSSYYAAYYSQQQQQNPNYASYYQLNYAEAYQPQQHMENYQYAPGQGLGSGYDLAPQGGQIGDRGPGTGQAMLGGPVAHTANVGSGSRGGRPYRGRGSGSFSNRTPGSGVTGPTSRGRGRGRGRASFSHMSQNGPLSSSIPNPSSDTVAEPTAYNHREQKPKTIAPNKPPGRTFRCELCRVDCTALDLLEQHKNGKKHKKNLEKVGQLQPVAVTTESVAEKIFKEIPTTETVGLGNTSSGKLGEDETQSGDQKRGTKRKMRRGQNGRSTRRANEPPKVVIPIICELCFVKCDTQEVYERHLSGKKHISKLKRYEDHQSMYGPIGLQALYPPMTQTFVNLPVPQQEYPGPQGSVPQPGPYMPPQAHYTTDQLATGAESGFQQNPGYAPGPT